MPSGGKVCPSNYGKRNKYYWKIPLVENAAPKGGRWGWTSRCLEKGKMLSSSSRRCEVKRRARPGTSTALDWAEDPPGYSPKRGKSPRETA